MANNTNGKPVAEIRVGRIIAAIWQNTPTDEGVFYSVHITRLFRRGLNWDRTPAFGRDDLLTVAKVADLANTRIYELQNAIEFRNPQDAPTTPNARNAAAGPLPAAAFSVHGHGNQKRDPPLLSCRGHRDVAGRSRATGGHVPMSAIAVAPPVACGMPGGVWRP